jgi:hypothetical protein
MVAIEAPAVPVIASDIVAGRIHERWNPRTAAHHVIFAVNRAGKTHLITRLLMPLCRASRVLIIDVKGDDDVWEGYGRPVAELPAAFGRQGDGPMRGWWRLVAPIGDPDSKRRVWRALDQIRDEGNCVVVIDECRAVTDNDEGFAARARVEGLLMRGGSRNVSVIIAAQDPGWVPVAMKTQGAFRYGGHIPNLAVQKRVAEMFGLSRAHVPLLLGVRKRQFLYVDSEEGEPMLALTTVGEM